MLGEPNPLLTLAEPVAPEGIFEIVSATCRHATNSVRTFALAKHQMVRSEPQYGQTSLNPEAVMNWYALLCTFAVIGIVTESRCELIVRDWQNPGDGLLTVDPATGREWLDWSVTQLSQFGGSFFEDGNRIEDAVPRVLEELEPGNRFAGFQVGSLDEVTGLFESAGIPIPSARFDMVPATVGDSFEQLTDATPFITYWVTGDLNPDFPEQPESEPYLAIVLASSGGSPGNPDFTTAQALGNGDAFYVEFSSLILFRVPEPQSLAVITSSIAVLSVFKRRRPLI